MLIIYSIMGGPEDTKQFSVQLCVSSFYAKSRSWLYLWNSSNGNYHCKSSFSEAKLRYWRYLSVYISYHLKLVLHILHLSSQKLEGAAASRWLQLWKMLILFCCPVRLKIAKSLSLLFFKACFEYVEKNLDRVREIAIWSTVAAYRRLKSLSLIYSGKERGT